MRQKYYKYLFENSIVNYLDSIEELSYSKKLQILKELTNKFSIESINKALIKYKQNYIEIGRVEIPKLKNILKGLCKTA
jgi:hypothetical protein